MCKKYYWCSNWTLKNLKIVYLKSQEADKSNFLKVLLFELRWWQMDKNRKKPCCLSLSSLFSQKIGGRFLDLLFWNRFHSCNLSVFGNHMYSNPKKIVIDRLTYLSLYFRLFAKVWVSSTKHCNYILYFVYIKIYKNYVFVLSSFISLPKSGTLE